MFGWEPDYGWGGYDADAVTKREIRKEKREKRNTECAEGAEKRKKGHRLKPVVHESVRLGRRPLQKLRTMLRTRLFVEESFYAGYVFGDVYAYGVVLDFGNAYFPAVFEPSELLELLDFFELALRQRRVFQQSVALENVEAEVLPVFDVDFLLGVADPGNRGAGEIKAVAFEVENCLHYIGIHDVAGVADGRGDGGDLGNRLFE